MALVLQPPVLQGSASLAWRPQPGPAGASRLYETDRRPSRADLPLRKHRVRLERPAGHAHAAAGKGRTAPRTHRPFAEGEPRLTRERTKCYEVSGT